MPLVAGDIAPDFSLPTDDGGTLTLQDFKGRKLVLFFYPKANTPGCTRESIAFSALRTQFERAGVAVVGVSADSLKAQQKFKTAHGLTVPLASDETHAMLTAYGAWGEKTQYGRTYMGITRTTVLIDAKGKIARVWSKVKVEGHADAVLEAAKAL